MSIRYHFLINHCKKYKEVPKYFLITWNVEYHLFSISRNDIFRKTPKLNFGSFNKSGSLIEQRMQFNNIQKFSILLFTKIEFIYCQGENACEAHENYWFHAGTVWFGWMQKATGTVVWVPPKYWSIYRSDALHNFSSTPLDIILYEIKKASLPVLGDLNQKNFQIFALNFPLFFQSNAKVRLYGPNKRKKTTHHTSDYSKIIMLDW